MQFYPSFLTILGEKGWNIDIYDQTHSLNQADNNTISSPRNRTKNARNGRTGGLGSGTRMR